MPTAIEIISDEPDWRDVYELLCGPSVLASFDYMRAAANLVEGGIAEAAVLRSGNETVFHPYIRRPIGQTGYFDVVSPYDYGGFWLSSADASRRREMAEYFATEFAAHSCKAGVVSEFIRVHPFTDASSAGLTGYEFRKHQDNVVIDLRLSMDAIRLGYTESRRNQVRQGRRNGLSLVFSTDLSAFVRLYYRSLDRLSASAEYYFPQTFLEAVSRHLICAHVVSPGGELCAAHLFLKDGDVLFLYLSASSPDALRLRPNDFGYDAMAHHAQENGFRVLHLGGGHESLYHYKRSFSSRFVPYYTARRIYLPKVYARLSAALPAAARADRPNFFPAYRVPAER